MIPILPSASLSKDRGNRPETRFVAIIVVVLLLLSGYLIGYNNGYRNGKKQGEIKILKAVAKIMVGALDKAAK